MSKSLHSPTARLLQHSRVFSLPRPLPDPALEGTSSTGMYRASDSATHPYPTHQAIATPASSHHRGDWGLKRSLPRRATGKTSTPTIRVRGVDNAAHITDFSSAADLVLTEAKWKQMGLPLLIQEQRSGYVNKKSHTSVYDDNVDNTDPEAVAIGVANASKGQLPRNSRDSAYAKSVQMKRWKYSGPWVTGMSGGEFELYILKQITNKKAEFREFLINRTLERRIQDEERELRDQGDRKPIGMYRREELRQEVLSNYEVEEKRLRDQHAVQLLTSELTACICDFLDLPGIRPSGAVGIATTAPMRDQIAGVASFDNVPPSTHPGAGLSHLRSSAFMENHPLWGPQAHRAPVLARVLAPRNNIMGSNVYAKLGVAGVVAPDSVGAAFNNKPSRHIEKTTRARYRDSSEMTSQMDLDLPGGNHIWVQPESAHIDEQGRIRLATSRGDMEAIAVKENDVEYIHEARSAIRRDFKPMAPPGTSGNANYGHGLPDYRKARPSAWEKLFTRGYDKELGRAPRQRGLDDREALTKIRSLASKHMPQK